MRIDFEGIEGEGPFIVTGFVNGWYPFELSYHQGTARLVIISPDFVATGITEYTQGLGILSKRELVQLVAHIVKELDKQV
jgi:hypothetical protein